MGSESVRTLKEAWEYHRRAAIVVGASPREADSPGSDTESDHSSADVDAPELAPPEKDPPLATLREQQANYSLAWFFEDPDARRTASTNPLVHHYLTGSLHGQEDPPPPHNADTEVTRFKNERLNPSQQRAVKEALAGELTHIQGPPGTGKTQVILELMGQIASRDKTAAIVSQNHAAVKNIIDRIHSNHHPANHLSHRVAELGNTNQREAFSRSHSEWAFRARVGGRESSISAERFLRRYPLITSTIHSLPKLFADGTSHLYDYVIIDEASQVNPIVGIVAMCCARRLILLGDIFQLPPVLDRTTVARVNRYTQDLTITGGEPWYLRTELSFLEAVSESTRHRDSANILLDTHYRCHPGIIGFANRHIYNNKLDIRTDTSTFFTHNVSIPIRVRWFPGAYGEKVITEQAKHVAARTNEKPKSTRRNRKQIEVFMREEWPIVQARLDSADGKDLSVCILSPYRGQLVELQMAIEQVSAKETVLGPLEDDQPPRTHDEQNRSKFESLTIHKAQGREFDIVYVLPVDDGAWEFPWSQHRRLINVAASRAKQELVIVVGSDQMSCKLQHKLLGRVVPPRRTPEGRELTNTQEDGADQMFLQRLIDDIARSTERDETAATTPGYGLERSELVSVFDDVTTKRRHIQRIGLKLIERHGDGYSAPEEVFAEALLNATQLAPSVGSNPGSSGDSSVSTTHSLLVIRELPLSACHGLAPLHDGGRSFDFAIVEEATGRLLVTIEIDGTYHRYNENQEALNVQLEADKRKDDIIRRSGGQVISVGADSESVLAPSCVLLRLPTDGRSWGEFSFNREHGKGASESEAPESLPATIEALVHAQLARTPEQPVIVDRFVTLRTYLTTHGNVGISSKVLHDELKARGFLTYGPKAFSYDTDIKKRGDSLEYRPTTLGMKHGLRTCMSYGRDGDPFWGIRIAKNSDGEVLATTRMLQKQTGI